VFARDPRARRRKFFANGHSFFSAPLENLHWAQLEHYRAPQVLHNPCYAGGLSTFERTS
jgi:hypothetical protein